MNLPQLMKKSFFKNSLYVNDTILRQLFSNAWTVYGSLVGGSILVWVLYEEVPHYILISWYVILVMITVARGVLSFKFKQRILPLRPRLISRWYLLFLVGIVISGTVWGSAIVFLFHIEDNPALTMFLIFILLGLTASSAAIYAPSMLAFFLFTQPILIPLTINMAFQGESIYMFMAILSIVYNLAMIFTASNFTRLIFSLKKSQELAVKANEAKSLFLANMNHELRTPMNGVLGMAHLLSKTQLSNQQLGYLNSLKTSSAMTLDLIDDVLDISKIEANKLVLAETTFNLREVLEKVVLAFTPQAELKGLAIVFTDQNSIKWVSGDPVRLTQILNNLIANAIKFTETGKIELECSSEQTAEELKFKCAIKDTGIGILESQQEAILELFTQVDQCHTRHYGGTGLGLAISKQLIELMGGELSIESVINQGSIFSFTVVFQLSHQEQIEMPVIASHDALKEKKTLDGLHVLLVEDDALNQKIAELFLEALGVKVSLAETGVMALEWLETNNPDFILMDIQMPEMNGYDASRAIRKIEKWRDLPVIALTAHALQGEKERCIEAGMNDYLTKPLDPELLEKMLGKWLMC